MRTRTKGLLVIAVPIVPLLALTFSAILVNVSERRAERTALHNAALTERTESILVGLLNAETGVRGFLLTGDGQFLEPYLLAQRSLPVALDELNTQTRNDPEMARMFEAVRSEVLERSLALSNLRRGGATGAILGAELETAKRGMDKLRVSLQAMANVGVARATVISDRRAGLQRWQRWCLLSSIAVGLAGGVFAGLWFVRWVDRTMTRINDLYHGAPCGYHTADAQTVIQEINVTELRWLGRTRAEVVGRLKLADLVTSESRERIEHRYQDFVNSGALTDMDIDLVAADGSILPASLTATALFDARGRYTGSRSTIFDITKRRRADNERRALAAELEHSLTQQQYLNRELEAFSYTVAHDLRSPLRALDGFSAALLEDYGDKFDAQGQQYLSRLRSGAQRMAVLIDELLRLARVSRTAVDRQDIDLTQLARTVAREVGEGEPDRVIDWQIADGLHASTDPVLCKVLLQNLFANASKFTAHVPQARIEFGAIHTEAGERFFVKDNGAGFDMQYSARLFGLFQRLHTEKEFSGTGVGLATVQRIVQKHGGTVSAEGAVGRGATISFTLPPAPTTSEEQQIP